GSEEKKEEVLQEIEEEKIAREEEEKQVEEENEATNQTENVVVNIADINVSNLDIEYDSDNNLVSLIWRNPEDNKFSGIVVNRKNNSEEKTVYQGEGEIYLDSDISFGQGYVYTVFVSS